MKLHNVPTVYLDLNHLIELAKIGRSSDTSQLDYLAHLTDSGKMICPIGAAQMVEIFPIKDPNQRLAIGNVIKRVCRKWFILDYFSAKAKEIQNVVADYYNRSDLKSLVEPSITWTGPWGDIFGTAGFAWAENLGLSEKENQIKLYKTITQNDDFLDFMLGQEVLPKLKNGGSEHAQMIQTREDTVNALAGLNKADQERHYPLTLQRSYIRSFLECSIKLGLRSLDDDSTILHEFLTSDFMRTIPTINVCSSLYYNLYHKNPQNPTNINDIFDINSLSVAVPYCDIVVTDKAMRNTVELAKLDKTYNTKVFQRLAEAVAYLKTIT